MARELSVQTLECVKHSVVDSPAQSRATHSVICYYFTGPTWHGRFLIGLEFQCIGVVKLQSYPFHVHLLGSVLLLGGVLKAIGEE